MVLPKWSLVLHRHMGETLKITGCVTNSVDPNQTPRSAADALGLHCLIRPYTK